MSEQHMLGITDFVVLGASLIVCAFIGLYFGKRDKADTVASYLLANRKMNFIPVAFSILATIMSALGMSGGIGEMYLYGFEYQLLTLFTCFGKLFVAYFIMPVFHQMQYVSVYEYLERRYDKTMRVVFSLIYLITNIIYLGIVLYVPALSLTTVTGVPYIATSCVTGVICIFYCVAGGYKAVIWTDVLQSFLMFSCFGLLIIKCMTKSGGLISAIENTYNGGRLHIKVRGSFDSSMNWYSQIIKFFHPLAVLKINAFQYRIFTNPVPQVAGLKGRKKSKNKKYELHVNLNCFVETEETRYSFWSLAFAGAIMSIKNFNTNQAGIQRLLSVKNVKVATRSLLLSIVLTLVFKGLLLFAGFAIYDEFKDCDPLSDPSTNVTSLDQILVYAVVVMLGSIPGLAGVALSGILSGSLSTLSSYINAFAALTLEDYLKPLFPKFTSNEKKNIIVCKFLTGFYGLLAIIVSFAMPYLGGAIKIYSTFVTAAYGPLCGIMFLGMFVPKTNAKVAKISLLLCVGLMSWLVTGSLLYPIKSSTLPMTTVGCPSQFTQDNYNLQNEYLRSKTNMTDSKKRAFSIYNISFMWYGPIGVTATLIVGTVLSLFMGNKGEMPDMKLLSPMLWSKEHKRNMCKEENIITVHEDV